MIHRNYIQMRSKQNIIDHGEVFTPFDIIEQMLDALPPEIYADPEFTFIEPTFGTGNFLIKIIEKCVSAGDDIYAACNRVHGWERSQENIDECYMRLLSLCDELSPGCDHARILSIFRTNLVQCHDSLIEMRKFIPGDIHKVAVIGNPPYQVADGGNSRSAKPIYHLFVEAAIDNLNPDYLSMIIPSRWMVGGKGLDKHRERMMNDNRMKVVVDDMSCNGIFPTVDIAGGVNYFLWEKEHDGKCEFNGVDRKLSEYDIIIRENEARSILSKITSKCENFMGGIVSASKPYGFRADTIPQTNGIPCWFKQSIGKSFVDPAIVKDSRGDIGKWKVLAPRAPIAGQTDFTKPIGFFTDKSIVIAAPTEVCTETYLVVNTFNSQKEAENFVLYMKTKLFRFLLRLRVISQDVTRECYNWVPDLQDYSAPWTDAELYKKFGLTHQEIAYIESKIKAI